MEFFQAVASAEGYEEEEEDNGGDPEESLDGEELT